MAQEQLNAQLLLKQFYMPADRAACDAQLIRRVDEPVVAGCGLKGSQRIEWGKGFPHKD
jgi:hypothetical protein